ncbi:hypothetical protein BDV95DRAFT_587639, partial [Massariosphaeria phaeospora]
MTVRTVAPRAAANSSKVGPFILLVLLCREFLYQNLRHGKLLGVMLPTGPRAFPILLASSLLLYTSLLSRLPMYNQFPHRPFPHRTPGFHPLLYRTQGSRPLSFPPKAPFLILLLRVPLPLFRPPHMLYHPRVTTLVVLPLLLKQNLLLFPGPFA